VRGKAGIPTLWTRGETLAANKFCSRGLDDADKLIASAGMGDAFNDVATRALRAVTKEGERVSSQLHPRTISCAS
jgi:hypothetical protein